MKFDVKGIIEKIKTSWQKLPDKSKKMLLWVGGGTLALAILISTYLGTSKMGYRVLFPGMTNEESTQVYATLQEMDVQPKIDTNGQILVPKDQWDELVFQLNGQGYPKTTLSYDTFSNASGFTSTEFEKKTALIFQAQDRMQQTLLRQEGIADATVTFTVPETSNYIWDQSNQQESTAGVTVLMKPGYTLTPERVTAIQHLAATSVPKLKSENVVVVDAATGIEVPGVDDPAAAGYYSVRRLEFENAISKDIEDRVKRLLAGKYGVNGVTAVATVTVDYDKMMSETKEYHPRENGDGGGVINHFEESYSLNGTVPVEGIVGEENNTDAPPIYPNADGTGDASATDYQKSIDYDVSYVLTQIERGEPILKKASVAVIVNDPDFDTETEETLVSLVSKAVNISTDNIKVTNLDFVTQPVAAPAPEGAGLSQRQILLLALVGLLFILLAIIIIVIFSRRRKKRHEQEEEEMLEAAERQRQLDLQKEIEEHKRKLQNEALAQAATKESAVTEDVRGFAHDNPEITAALLRSLLREEK